MATSPTKLTTITLRLPWPPSVNHYWKHVYVKPLARVVNYIAPKGKKYREDVLACVLDERPHAAPLTCRLAVSLECVMPDRRKRDLDNIPKCVLDSLTHANVYGDDSQIDLLIVRRLAVEPPGCIDATIQELVVEDMPGHLELLSAHRTQSAAAAQE